MKNKRLGEYFFKNTSQEILIIDYIGANNCSIQFIDGTILHNKKYLDIVKNRVKNPNSPRIYEVGYIGIGKYNTTNSKKYYELWVSLLFRCYAKESYIKTPTYKDCYVAEKWHNFQNFAQWCDENYIKGFHLDKDISIKDNKLYSSETCCFVPQEINNIFTKRQNNRGLYPSGVQLSGKSYVVNLSKYGKNTYIGTFKTPEEAFQAYKIAKEVYIKEVADKWKGQITEQTYKALINYNIEITD